MIGLSLIFPFLFLLTSQTSNKNVADAQILLSEPAANAALALRHKFCASLKAKPHEIKKCTHGSHMTAYYGSPRLKAVCFCVYTYATSLVGNVGGSGFSANATFNSSYVNATYVGN